MNPYLLIRQFFVSEKEVLGKPYDEVEPSESEPPFTPEAPQTYSPVPSMVSGSSSASKTDLSLPVWLADEDALRDEGVIFGLTDAHAEEKVRIIEAIFAEKVASNQKKVELLSEKIGEFNLKLGQYEEQLQTKSAKALTYSQAEKETHQLPRALVSLLLSGVMALGNFFLIDSVFVTAFPEYHYLVSAGVFLAGMFTLFSGISVLHHSEESHSPVQWLRELALPVSASIFVWSIALSSMSGFRAFGLFLFVLSLFLYSGKLFLENLVEARNDFSAWLQNQRIDADLKRSVGNLEDDMEQIKEKMDEIRLEKWKIIPELSEAEGRINQMLSQRDSLIHLFQSEFKLARSYREKLTQSQIKRIVE